MNWIEAILKIREARENNRLVLFVGSGVSKNSNVPTWGELIRDMADIIGYDRCAVCDLHEECDKNENRGCKQQLSQDEFLKIPEYYYQKDSSQNKDNYYSFIKNKLDVKSEPNLIDHEIFRVMPHHIITTNYDSLLERTKTVNVGLYSVITKDEEILSKSNPRYLIKMHGDFADMSSIVLKESDYLQYEQERPLISTFIRSLLIDHIFVFLGYSLNDSNLNLIIGWINYYKEKHKVSKRPNSFLLTSSNISEFEKQRLENKSIYPIDLRDIPVDIIKDADGITSIHGRNLYSFMRLISDDAYLRESIPYTQFLNEKLSLLRSYLYVSMEDFLNICALRKVNVIGDVLVFMDKHEYESFCMAISKKDEIVESAFKRSMIKSVVWSGDDSKMCEIIKEDFGEIERLYLDNRYVDLKRTLSKENITTQIYYAVFFGEDMDSINAMLKIEDQEMNSLDYIAVLLHKMRERLSRLSHFDRQNELTREINQIFDMLPYRYRVATGFLYKLTHSEDETKQKMQGILDKQRDHYVYRMNGFRSGHAFQHIYKLQSFVYDYYFYFKRNMLPIDHFSDPKRFFEYYVQAILCTYAPLSDVTDNDWGPGTHRERYPLNEIDLDIIVKYTNEKELKKWINENTVSQIKYKSNINVSMKFKNLCDSLKHLKRKFIAEEIVIFSIIVSSSEDTDLRRESFVFLIELFTLISEKSPELCVTLFPAVYELSSSVSFCDNISLVDQLVRSMCRNGVFIKLYERYESQIQKLLKGIGDSCSKETKDYLVDEISAIDDKTERIARIVVWRSTLPMIKYHLFIQENIDLVRVDQLFDLIIDKYVDYDERIDKLFLSRIEKEVESRKENPFVRTFPDWLKLTINNYIILYLLGFKIEVKNLFKYKEYSLYIDFLVSPDTFDYSLVDLSDYMWQNLIRSEQYQKKFIEHRTDLLTEKLKKDMVNDVATRDQNRIVYGLLLEKDELWNY